MVDKGSANQILATIRNQVGTAEGSLLPPPQKGQFRVPFVTNLKLFSTTAFIGGTQFVITFNTPTDTVAAIDHYNVFVSGLSGNLTQTQGPVQVNNSPATVSVYTSVAQKVIITVQTVLKNGLLSDLSSGPTCSGTTLTATINAGNITNNSIEWLAKIAPEAAGDLPAYDSSGNPTLIAPVAAGSFLVSNGTSNPPQYQTIAALGLVTDKFKATADATVANTITETSIVGTGSGSMTLAANTLGVGTTVRIKTYGYLSSNATTLRIKVKAGSTVLGDTTALNVAGTPQNSVIFDAIFTCRTTGVSGTVVMQGMFQSTSFLPLINTAPITLNTTVSQLIDVTATWGAAASANSITITNLTLEVLN